MTYEEFKKELVNALSKKFGDGSVSIANALFMGKETEIIKITIGNRESMCSAKPLFNLHKRDKQPLSYYVSMLESALKEVETPPLLQPSRILYKLVNQKEDAEFLSRAPYLPFYDMAITFLYQLDENMQSKRYLAITNDIMEEKNLTVSKLVDLAHENTQRMYPCQTTFLPAQIFENMYFDPSASAEKFIAFALTAFEERSHHSVPMYHDIIHYSGNMWGKPHPDDLSRCENYADFLEKLNLCIRKFYMALRKDGRLAVLVGDIRSKGQFYSIQHDMMRMGDFESFLVKGQFNCVSDTRRYNKPFIPIVTEYLLLLHKKDALMIPFHYSIDSSFSVADTNLTALTWHHLIRMIFKHNGGKMSLCELYAKLQNHPKSKDNPHFKERIRATIYEHRNEYLSCGNGIYSLSYKVA